MSKSLVTNNIHRMVLINFCNPPKKACSDDKPDSLHIKNFVEGDLNIIFRQLYTNKSDT